jgi:hypothetical protein
MVNARRRCHPNAVTCCCFVAAVGMLHYNLISNKAMMCYLRPCRSIPISTKAIAPFQGRGSDGAYTKWEGKYFNFRRGFLTKSSITFVISWKLCMKPPPAILHLARPSLHTTLRASAAIGPRYFHNTMASRALLKPAARVAAQKQDVWYVVVS